MKNIRKLLSIVIVITLLFSALPFTAFAAEGVSVSYSFANDKAGFAEGTVTVSTDKANAGTYYLYWADDTSALDGYYAIAAVDASSGKGAYTFLPNIAIPADATKLIAIKSAAEPTDKTVANATAVYDIDESKLNPNTSSDKTLSFMTVSDTQLDYQNSPFYTYAEEHFKAMLENAADRNVDFITTCGDCVNNYEDGTSKEWQMYQKFIAESSYVNPIYETNGNHSMKSDIKFGIEAYITATGLGIDDGTLADKPYYEMTAENGDHFIFASLETSDNVGDYDEFSAEQLDWLEETIAKYYDDGHHIFVFEHAFFHGWGPGDDKENHYYGGGLRTSEEFPGNKRFRSIMDRYNEVFLYTGHSHLDFMYNWNYDNENGEGANMFHVPSTACTNHITNGELDYEMDASASQCYVVDCFDDMVISYGMNVVDNKIYPQYSYIVNTSEYTHEVRPEETQPETESSTDAQEMVDVQIENGTSYLFNDGAKLFFYNNATGNYYPVNSSTGIAEIPANAASLTLYRCDGEWGSGNKTDSVTSFWNKYGPAERAEGQLIFYVGGSSKYNWKDGEVQYPEPPATQDQPEPTEPTEPTPQDPTTSDDPADLMEIRVIDATSSGWIYSSGAKLFLYDKDGKKAYEVKSEIANVPKNAVNFTVYRCNAKWGSGNVSDDVTTYWNKWDLSARKDGDDIVSITSDKKYSWMSSAGYDPEQDSEFYLIGYFNGADYSGKGYKFDENGQITVQFTGDSYVHVMSSAGTFYWTNGWLGYNATSATLYRASSISDTNKLFVNAGKVTFTLVSNEDGTLTISYESEPIKYDPSEIKTVYDVMIGDADLDGAVTIVDATVIQRHLAKLKTLDAKALYAADVYGNGKVEISCATLIQRNLAKLANGYPVEKEEEKDISTLESLMAVTRDTLSEDFRYASYVAYSNLKKAYFEYKDADLSALDADESSAAYKKLLEVYNKFNTMKENNNVVSVYFCNYIAWSSVKAYIKNSETGKEIKPIDDAMGISKLEITPSGARMYMVTVNRSKWDKLTLTDGQKKRTVEVDIPTVGGYGFYSADGSANDDGQITLEKFIYADSLKATIK